MECVSYNDTIDILNSYLQKTIAKDGRILTTLFDQFNMIMTNVILSPIATTDGYDVLATDITLSIVLSSNCKEPGKEIFQMQSSRKVAFGSKYDATFLEDNAADIVRDLLGDIDDSLAYYYHRQRPKYTCDLIAEPGAHRLFHFLLFMDSESANFNSTSQLFSNLWHDIYSKDSLEKEYVDALRVIKDGNGDYIRFYEDSDGILILHEDTQGRLRSVQPEFDYETCGKILLINTGGQWRPSFSGNLQNQLVERYKLTRKLST